MPEQEFLASFGVQIDEDGVNRLLQALSQNRALAEELASAFGRARETVQAFFRELNETAMPSQGVSSSARVAEEQAGFSVPLALDFTKANRDLQAFLKTADRSLKLSADASAVIAAGQSALYQLQAMFASSVLPLQASLRLSGSLPSAAGSFAGALAALPGLLDVSGLSGPVTNNSSRSVQAPVSINVTASGTNPEAVGRSVYDVTEQYLLRTLKGAM